MDAVQQLLEFLKTEFPSEWNEIISKKNQPSCEDLSSRSITTARYRRALFQKNITLKQNGNQIDVCGVTGDYVIDPVKLTCTCKDFLTHDVWCKHLIKAALTFSHLGNLKLLEKKLQD